MGLKCGYKLFPKTRHDLSSLPLKNRMVVIDSGTLFKYMVRDEQVAKEVYGAQNAKSSTFLDTFASNVDEFLIQPLLKYQVEGVLIALDGAPYMPKHLTHAARKRRHEKSCQLLEAALSQNDTCDEKLLAKLYKKCVQTCESTALTLKAKYHNHDKVYVLQSLFEADHMCVALQTSGLADFVISDDSDMLAIGATNVLSRIQFNGTNDMTCYYWTRDNVTFSDVVARFDKDYKADETDNEKTEKLPIKWFASLATLIGNDYLPSVKQLKPQVKLELLDFFMNNDEEKVNELVSGKCFNSPRSSTMVRDYFKELSIALLATVCAPVFDIKLRNQDEPVLSQLKTGAFDADVKHLHEPKNFASSAKITDFNSLFDATFLQSVKQHAASIIQGTKHVMTFSDLQPALKQVLKHSQRRKSSRIATRSATMDAGCDELESSHSSTADHTIKPFWSEEIGKLAAKTNLPEKHKLKPVEAHVVEGLNIIAFDICDVKTNKRKVDAAFDVVDQGVMQKRLLIEPTQVDKVPNEPSLRRSIRIKTLEQQVSRATVGSNRTEPALGKQSKDSNESTKQVRVLRLRLKPTRSQRSILVAWQHASRAFWNTLVEYQRTGESCTNHMVLNNLFASEAALSSRIDNQGKLEAILELPAKLRQEICKQFATGVKSATTNVQRGHQKQFQMRFKSKKMNLGRITLPIRSDMMSILQTNNTHKLKLAKMRTSVKIKYCKLLTPHALSKLTHGCQIVFQGNCWYADMRYALDELKVAKPINLNPCYEVGSADPGYRDFLSLFTNNRVLTINPVNKEKGKQVLEKVSVLRSLLDNYKNSLNKNLSKVKAKTKKKARNKLENQVQDNLPNKYIRYLESRIRLLYAKHKNLMKDFHRKTVSFIVNNFRRFNIGELGNKFIKQGRNKQLKKDGDYLRHYSFRRRLLTFTAVRNISVVNESFTSKTCCKCGEINNSLGSSKVFNCESCNATFDRDFNASCNIYYKSC